MKQNVKFQLTLILVCISFIGSAQNQSKPETSNDAIFNFVVTSVSGKPRQGDLIILKSKKTSKSYQSLTGADGKCSLTIPPDDKYTIYYKVFIDTVKYTEVDVPAGQRMAYTLSMKYDPPKKFTLKNIFFETGLSKLTKESNPALNELVEVLKAKKSMVIEISGHTDNVGNPEANQKLSTDRAKAVKDYLVKQGIDPKRLNTVGYGDSQPVADNDTPEGRQQNRRTEVRIISQ
jgi:outer membrane protein OmpA-like peptidoglycan-associated protein